MRPFSADPLTGITTLFHDDPGIDGFHLETKQDCDPILENLRKMREEGNYKGESMWFAGSIPNVLWEQWAQEAGVHPSDEAMVEISKKKLNSGEWNKLRGGDFRI